MWAVQNYKSESAFQVDGKLRLQYLCNLASSHAEYIVQKTLMFEKNAEVTKVLQTALMEVNPTAAIVRDVPAYEIEKEDLMLLCEMLIVNKVVEVVTYFN